MSEESNVYPECDPATHVKDMYDQLTEEFTTTYTLRKGNTDLSYLTLEQVVTRLNTVLGVDGWSFTIHQHGQDETHCWAHGALSVDFGEKHVIREQMGECSIQRGMAIGDSRKGAVSDSLKKCASLIGVGLYLSHKEEEVQAEQMQRAPEIPLMIPTRSTVAELTVACDDCGASIKGSQRDDGSTWTAQEKAQYSRGKYGRVLCFPCTRKV